MSPAPALIDRVQRRSGTVLLFGLMLLFPALGVRLAYINIAWGPTLLAIADRQQHGSLVIPARRGMILDTRGRVVAVSRQHPDVFVDPSLLEDVDRVAAALAARVNLPAPEIASRIRRRGHSRFVLIARQVDQVTAEAVRALGYRGVGLTDGARRTYPLGDSLSPVLGWVGRDGCGLEGIELALDDHLRGEDGRRATLRDARRRALRRSPRASMAPVDGGHVVLTIDAEVQRITEEALDEAITCFEADSGVAIVMSPENGAVLAMASLPTVDPNQPFTPEFASLRRNRAVTDPVEPGSTFKPMIACAALDAGLVSPTEIIDCGTGSRWFGRRLVKDTRPNGPRDLLGIITHSSNIGMGVIATRMGNERLYDAVLRFGFGQPTGISFPGESPGRVRPLEKWDTFSTTSIPMGYEILVTPLQLLNAFAAIVNDGVVLRPRLVRRLLAPDGQVVQAFDTPQIVRRAVSSDVARYMARELLVSVVENGGGHRAQVGPYRVLGKTGTAKLVDGTRGVYAAGAYLGLFVGAAPVDDPQLVALAMVRRPNPGIGYYGGKVAAPAVGNILAQALAYLGVQPDAPSGLAGL